MKNPEFVVGQKVTLRDDYDGYFVEFKNRIVTVKEVIPLGKGLDSYGLRIEEILKTEEFHIILARHFDAAPACIPTPELEKVTGSKITEKKGKAQCRRIKKAIEAWEKL